MKFACPKCSTRYSISDDKLPADKTLRFTCKKCANVFKLRRKKKTTAAAPKAAAASPAPMDHFGDGATRVANVNEIMAVKRRSKAEEEADAAAAAAAGPSRPPPASPFAHEEDWYALVQGKQLGPLSVTELKEMVTSARITERTYIWRDGMADWVRLGTHKDLKRLVERTPAPPVAPDRAVTDETDFEPPSEQELAHEDAATVAMNMARLQEELKRLQKPAEPLRADDSDAALAALVGEPTGESGFSRREHSDPQRDSFVPFEDEHTPDSPGPMPDAFGEVPNEDGPKKPRLGRRDDYYQAAPGEATRIFMATAGLYKRRRTQKVAAIVGVSFTVLLTTIVALDIAGVITIPGMGLMYDVTGMEDPDAERAIARTEAKLEKADLTPEEREALRLRTEAMRAKLMGAPTKSKAKAKAKAKRVAPTEPVAEVGIKEAKDVDAADSALAAALMSDSRKRTKAPTLRPPSEIQTPNLPEGLTQDSIFEVINKNQRAMSLCISQSMKAGEQLTGKMEVEMSIGANGIVKSAAIGTDRFVGSTIGNCTVKTVKRWKFPAFNGQPVTVIFPYVLSAAF